MFKCFGILMLGIIWVVVFAVSSSAELGVMSGGPFISPALPIMYNFSSIDYPGAVMTYAKGINNRGQIVGDYWYPNSSDRHGFFLDEENFTSIESRLGFNVEHSGAFGINDTGQIVGYYYNFGSTHGYLLDRMSFTTFDVPDATYTLVIGINNRKQIAGISQSIPSFLYSRGNFTSIDFPGALGIEVRGINDRGEIVGFYNIPSGNKGFVFASGSFTSIEFPGVFQTYANGINNAGQIVGCYYDLNERVHSFLLDGGVFTSFDIPYAQHTLAWGINDRGEIVGIYHDTNGFVHGFLATPIQ